MSSYKYASFANYITGSTSDIAARSKKISAALKRGSSNATESMFIHFDQHIIDLYEKILNEEVTLVPVPRSHPLLTTPTG